MNHELVTYFCSWLLYLLRSQKERKYHWKKCYICNQYNRCIEMVKRDSIDEWWKSWGFLTMARYERNFFKVNRFLTTFVAWRQGQATAAAVVEKIAIKKEDLDTKALAWYALAKSISWRLDFNWCVGSQPPTSSTLFRICWNIYEYLVSIGTNNCGSPAANFCRRINWRVVGIHGMCAANQAIRTLLSWKQQTLIQTVGFPLFQRIADVYDTTLCGAA